MAGSGTAHLRPAGESVLRIENLVVEFPVGRSGLKVNAVSSVSIDVLPGETLGLVGESGCGKSTMGKAVMQLVHATSGSVLFEGTELTKLSGDALRDTRPKLQMIFQDPISSLNPRRRVRDIVREGLDIWKLGTRESRAKRVDDVLETVGIDPAVAGPKRPHEFSGGQCQRISIARAVATEPKLIICDEPVSALDVSVQAQILNLLEDMKRQYGLTLIFIAHDLAVVKNVSDKVAVMYLGKLCEFAHPDTLYAAPAHPYTAALLSAIPEPDPEAHTAGRAGVGGEIPSPLSPPSGCRFRTRCPAVTEICASEEPMMREVRPGHFVACHHPLGAITVAPPVAGMTGRVAEPAVPAPAWTPAPAPSGAAMPPSMPSSVPPTIAPPLSPSTPAVAEPPVAPSPMPPPVTAAPPTLAPTPTPAAEPEPDSWLAEEPSSRRRPEIIPEPVDWTPEPPAAVTPVPPTPTAPAAMPPAVDEASVPVAPIDEPPAVVAPTPAPPPPAPPAVDEAPDAELPPPTPEPPSFSGLDTLLPDRTRGGSIKPEKKQ